MNQLAFTYDAPPRQRHSRTSRAAAERVAPKALTRRQQVYAFLVGCAAHGATDEEMQARIPMGANTQRPRRVELVTSGHIFDSGKTRATVGGDQAVVWITTSNRDSQC